MSMTTTSPPSRRTAWAISTPTGPPPRISRRRGIAFMDVASRLLHTPLEVAQPRDRRHHGIGTVGEHDMVSGVAHAVDLDRARTGEPPAAAQQVDAVIGEPAVLSRIGPVRGHEVAPGERRLDVDLGGGRGVARPVHRLARPQQRLGRNARPVRALTAHELALDDGHAQTALRELPCAVLARRAAAEHDHVVVAVHAGQLLWLLSECEDIRVRPGVEEMDLERVLSHRAGLPDELLRARLLDWRLECGRHAHVSTTFQPGVRDRARDSPGRDPGPRDAQLLRIARIEALDELGTPRRRLPGIAEVDPLAHDLLIAELHDADDHHRLVVVVDRVLVDPEVVAARGPVQLEALARRIRGPERDDVRLSAHALATLRPLQDRVVGVDLRGARDLVSRSAAGDADVRGVEVRPDQCPCRCLGHRGPPEAIIARALPKPVPRVLWTAM